MPGADIQKIYDEVIKSKKYFALYEPLLMRICTEESVKYDNNRERVKAVKNTLHSMYGAYLSADSFKKTGKMLEIYLKNGGDFDILNQILRLHASTNERLGNLTEFYTFIYNETGAPGTILDIGCGFNPFTVPYLRTKPKKYYAYDIDIRIADINNRFFLSLNMPELAGCADITVETPAAVADAAFIFKLLPLIERQYRGRCLQLLRDINAQYLIITYPIKSLGGREKGMREFYSATFENMTRGIFNITAKKEIGTEMIYIIDKGRN